MSTQPVKVPAIRRYNLPLPLALNTRTRFIDQSTGLTFTHFNAGTVVLDMINDPDPAAGLRYTIFLIKGSVDTGREFFSTGLSAASAGRMSIGPIKIEGPCDLALEGAQTAGGLAVTSVAVKFSNL